METPASVDDQVHQIDKILQNNFFDAEYDSVWHLLRVPITLEHPGQLTYNYSSETLRQKRYWKLASFARSYITV